jgi:uncharacterized YceG family protein
MVQQRPGLIPPRPGPPPRRAPRRTILIRRALALGVLVALIGFGVWLAYTATRGGDSKTATPTQITSIRRVPDFRVIFPEGFTRAEMARRVKAVAKIAYQKRKVRPKLSSRTYLAATRPRRIAGFGAKKRRLEGFLFPATYNFTAKTTSAKLVADQLKAFRDNWGKVDLRFARSKNLTPYDILIIASMVERETLAPDERPLVAAVIYNRLRNGMPLGIDATLRYGLGIPGTESIRESQLQSTSPYNTRNRTGLPPTPIANPGLASLQAAAHPAKVDYLYFVRKPDKVHHFFTSSYRAFQNYANAHGY